MVFFGGATNNKNRPYHISALYQIATINGLGEPGTTELGITCKSGIRYNGIGYNGIRHNEVSSKQESGIT